MMQSAPGRRRTGCHAGSAGAEGVRRRLPLWGVLGALVFSSPVMASLQAEGVSLDATRYLYMADKSDLPVTVRNETNETYLAQLWVRGLDEKSGGAAEGGRQPFLLAPPLHRMAPRTSQTFRLIGIARLTGMLPKDRESVFFVSAKMIPAREQVEGVTEPAERKGMTGPKALAPGLGGKDNEVAMQVVMVTNVKLFYRPTGLRRDGVVEAAEGLSFSLRGTGPKDRALVVRNPSPYYITFATLIVGDGKVEKVADMKKTADGTPAGRLDSFHMVPPKGEYAYPVPEAMTLPAGATVTWQVIDEHGMPTPEQQTLLRN